MESTRAVPASLRGRYQVEQAQLAAREATASWARLAVFAAWAVTLVAVWPAPAAVGATLAAGIAAFAVIVRVHQRLKLRREQADRILLMLTESENRIGGRVVCVRDWARPADRADIDAVLPPQEPDSPVWRLTDQERDDLDLFARPVGLFGLLNRTSTALGARRLRDRLDALLLDAGRIDVRQAAVRWLAENHEARVRIMGAVARLRDEDKRSERFIEALAGVAPLQLPVPLRVAQIWSIFSALAVATVAVLAVSIDTQLGWLLGGLLPVNTGIYVSMRGAFAAALERWKDTSWAIAGFADAIGRMAAELPAEGPLGRLKAAAAGGAEGRRLERMSARAGWTESGGMVHFLFNIVAFHELHVANSLIGLALPARDRLLAAISAVSEVEFLCSLACFAAEQPVRCYPSPAADAEMVIRGGVHPLVAPDRVVANDLCVNSRTRIWLITGSNMAGKSTFLRMAGLSVVLGQLGGVVTAKEMRWRPMRLITDLRARDNLAESESYFLSEVRHLRRLILPPAGPEPLLGLIDEPFRGTNSQDQSAASVAVVKHLLNAGHLVLLATHDRNLTLLADGSAMVNYHFRENLGADGMVFDYRLHDGPATTRNALRILEREGYPPALLEAAHGWLSEPHGES